MAAGRQKKRKTFKKEEDKGGRRLASDG